MFVLIITKTSPFSVGLVDTLQRSKVQAHTVIVSLAVTRQTAELSSMTDDCQLRQRIEKGNSNSV